MRPKAGLWLECTLAIGFIGISRWWRGTIEVIRTAEKRSSRALRNGGVWCVTSLCRSISKARSARIAERKVSNGMNANKANKCRVRSRKSKKAELSAAEIVYCENKAKLNDDRAAFAAAFPDEMALPERTLAKRIERLNKKRLVIEKVAAIRDRFATKVADKYDGLKEKLIDKMVDAIDAITADNPASMVVCVPMVKQISTMMGYDADHKVTVRNGGLAPDYLPPQNILEMSDEELNNLIGATAK